MSPESAGVIEPGTLLLAKEAKRRLHQGDWAWRQMRRAGLPIIYQGAQAFVFGDDVLAFFARLRDGGQAS